MSQGQLARQLWQTLSGQWRLMLAVLPGLALTTLHSAMLDLPRGDVIAALDSDHYRVQWLTGSYILGSAAGMALTQLLGSRLGLRRAYLLGLFLFAAAGCSCGFLSEVLWMTPPRLVQGLGNGLVISVGMVLLWRAFPRRRDLAMALYGMAAFLPALAGAPLGGFLTAWASWRLLFLINLPLGLVVGLLAWSVLPGDAPTQPAPAPMDWLGLGLLLAFVVALNVVFDRGQYWGWLNSPFFVPWFVAFVGSLTAFVAWGVWGRQPLINLRPLGVRNFALGLGIKVFFSINFYVLISLLSGYMIRLRGYQWWQGSLVLVPGVAAMLLGVTAGAILGTDANRKARMAAGLALMTLATGLLTQVDLYTARGWQAGCVTVWGFGGGLVVGPALLTAFEGLTTEQTLRTAGVFNILRSLPVFLVAGLLATLLTRSTDAEFDWLRQTVQHNRPIVTATLGQAERHFVQRGKAAAQAGKQAHATLGKWTHATAQAYAIQDTLRLLALVPAAGLVLVFLVRVSPGQKDEEGTS